MLFINLKEAFGRLQLGSGDIWNMDETGIKTVQIYDRVIARRGCRYIETLMSAEPGKLATSALDVSAAGNRVPPCSIFPRVEFRAHFLNGVPAEIHGDGSRPGWMQAELFVKSVKHFFPHVKPSRERPVILLWRVMIRICQLLQSIAVRKMA
jgi:hypothetical protein